MPNSIAENAPPGSPGDARTGELGILQRPDGGISTEISITVTDRRLNDGKPTNIPLLVLGQINVQDLLAGKRWTREQEDIAIRRAVERMSAGQTLPSFFTIEEAEAAARARSDAGGSRKKFEKQQQSHPLTEPQSLRLENKNGWILANQMVAGSGAVPPPEVPQAQDEAPPRPRLIPLMDALRDAMSGARQSPDVGDMIRQGSQDLLPKLREPLFPIAGSTPYMPHTLSDAAPIYQQVETAPEESPDWFYGPLVIPRPMELVTPRERNTLAEWERIWRMEHDDSTAQES